jgi:hypothetical protein
MLRHWIRVVMTCALTLSCLSAMAENSSVSGTGEVLLRPKATMLRFHLVLTERGDDMELTLKNLDHKGEAFRKALLAAKATPDSICLSTPKLIGGLRALGELAPTQQYRGKGKQRQSAQQTLPQQKYQQPNSVQSPNQRSPAEQRLPRITLQTQLTAEWPLQEASVPKLLVEADGIVRRAHEKILPIIPLKKKAGESQTQMLNTAPNAAANKAPNDAFDPDDSSDVDDSPDTCEPTYVFVGVVSEEQLREAKANAFKEASDNAVAKAKIADLAIGSPRYLEVSNSLLGDDGEIDPFGDTRQAGHSTAGRRGALSVARLGSAETTASDPSSLQCTITVNVTFRLTPSSHSTIEAK